MNERCPAHITMHYGELFCRLPRNHDGEHISTSRYDSRDVKWTVTVWVEGMPGDDDLFTIYVCPDGWEYAFVTDTEYFEDELDAITVTRRRYRLVDEAEMTYYPPTTLCPTCNGALVVDSESGIRTTDDNGLRPCPDCEDDPGRHPHAGEWVEEPT